jgi:NAD(P)-dependent dehydrogenase (short-subunit alcohol dehydrogenase family)
LNIHLQNQVAIVTGAASGIGRATALKLAAAGARVACLDIDRVGLEDTLARMRLAGFGYSAAMYICDVTDEEQVNHVVQMVAERMDPPHFLINCVGVFPPGSLITGNTQEIRKGLETNLLSPLLMARAVWPYFRANSDGGVIVNLGSIQAEGVYAWPNLYGAAKAGVQALTEHLAVEGAPFGIRTACVAPGAISTPIMANWSGMPTDFVNDWRRMIPEGRRGNAEEVANAILFFCTPLASYTTGATLAVTGGLHAQKRPPQLCELSDESAHRDPDTQPRE